jgi:biofilm protein TabA
MKRQFVLFVLIILSLSISNLRAAAQDKVTWNNENATKWFNKREWLTKSKVEKAVKYDAFGRTIEPGVEDTPVEKVAHLDMGKLTPHQSIDKVEFAKQYHANPERWNTAFNFLQTADLATIKPGKHAIIGDTVYALVTEGPARKEDTAKWESHKNYIDIHYVIKGQEKIGVAPLSAAEVVNPYDPVRDIAFYTARGKNYIAGPDNFFIFFPKEAHRPNLQVRGNELVKKIVIKIRREDI